MFIVVSIEESKDIDHMSVEELQSTLLVHEQKVQETGQGRRTSVQSGTK